MSDMITAEAAGKLLEDDDGSIIAVDDDGDAYLLPSGLPNNLLALPACDDNGAVLNALQWQNMVARFNAAPDFARTVIALHADRDRLAAANAALEAQVARLVGALTPSGDTKAAYMGEIKDPDTKRMVSWTVIKMVMAMISARAAIRGEGK